MALIRTPAPAFVDLAAPATHNPRAGVGSAVRVRGRWERVVRIVDRRLRVALPRLVAALALCSAALFGAGCESAPRPVRP